MKTKSFESYKFKWLGIKKIENCGKVVETLDFY